jgi:hypothetical protein
MAIAIGQVVYYQLAAADLRGGNVAMAGQVRLATCIDINVTAKLAVDTLPGDGLAAPLVVSGIATTASTGNGTWAVCPVRQRRVVSVCMNGRNGAGNWAVGAVLAGDTIESVVEPTAGADITADFTSPVAVNGNVVQTTATNYAAVLLTLTVSRANS